MKIRAGKRQDYETWSATQKVVGHQNGGEAVMRPAGNRPEVPAQRKENNTGLPDHGQLGLRNLFGDPTDDVESPCSSARPAQLNRQSAHAHSSAQKQSGITKGRVANTVQRKIHVKSGQKFDGAKKETTAPRLVAIANSANIYYVRSMEDVNKMKNSEDVPVLADKKHLIGEHHARSRFEDAVADWGWASSILIEAYSTHKRLAFPDQTETEKTTFDKGTYDQKFIEGTAKGLEDTGAKGLSRAVNAKILGSSLLNIVERFRKRPELFKVDEKVLELSDKETSELLKSNKKIFLDLYPKVGQKFINLLDLARALSLYFEQSSKQWKWRRFPQHALVKKALDKEIFNDIGEGIENILAQMKDSSQLHIDPAIIQKAVRRADQLIPVMEKLVVAYDKELELKDVRAMTAKAMEPTGNIDALDPLREKYMRKNIAASKAPTLVKIGQSHVRHMQKTPPANSIPYLDYDAFVSKNTAENVDV